MKATPSTQDRAVRALKWSWRAEVESARAYHELANVERDAHRKQVLTRMAEAEERHAAKLAERLRVLGQETPTLKGNLRSRWQQLPARLLGVELTLRRMEATEDRQAADYASLEANLREDAEGAQILHEISVEEKAHSHVIQQMVTVVGARTTLDYMQKREHWHGRAGNWVADAIYGVNDGLGAVFGIVSGVAGATGNQQHVIILAGLAATMASALSMGSGAYLAVKSEREVHEAEMASEQRELAEDPEEEIEEMALYYQLQGFEDEQARAMAHRLAEDPETMLRAMAQAELGLSDDRLPNPWTSAFSATLSTAIGAFIPIVPFFFMQGFAAVIAAATVSLGAHFLVGAAKTLITNRRWWASGFEMMAVGAVEGIITYGLGLAFGRL
jgi:VIT1/CCC1 family predicted Fe2+/Mn2+ transporter/rubrerythrin